MNQIMPIIENSDAEVVILGGDFNDHPLSGKTIRKSKNWIRDEGIMRLGDWGLVGLGDQGIQGDGRVGALWDQGDQGEGCWGIRGIKGMGECGDWVDREDWGIGDQGSRIFSLLLQLFFFTETYQILTRRNHFYKPIHAFFFFPNLHSLHKESKYCMRTLCIFFQSLPIF